MHFHAFTYLIHSKFIYRTLLFLPTSGSVPTFQEKIVSGLSESVKSLWFFFYILHLRHPAGLLPPSKKPHPNTLWENVGFMISGVNSCS